MGFESLLQNIPHSASSVTIEWFGSGSGYGIGPSTGNDGADETWAIENLAISVTPVPEPSTISRCLIAVCVGGLVLRRRKAQSHPA